MAVRGRFDAVFETLKILSWDRIHRKAEGISKSQARGEIRKQIMIVNFFLSFFSFVTTHTISATPVFCGILQIWYNILAFYHRWQALFSSSIREGGRTTVNVDRHDPFQTTAPHRHLH